MLILLKCFIHIKIKTQKSKLKLKKNFQTLKFELEKIMDLNQGIVLIFFEIIYNSHFLRYQIMKINHLRQESHGKK